jgi:connector enhancer of kinase suppressor of Ras 2
VAQYRPLFIEYEVDGRKLLMLNHSDLEKIGINKLGHQELVLEAVDLLRSLVICFSFLLFVFQQVK